VTYDGSPIRVKVPATSANLGAGFDCLGIALHLHDVYEFRLSKSEQVHVEGVAKLDIAIDQPNLALDSARQLSREVGKEFCHLRLDEYTNIPVARGLGSSAGAIVAGLAAANHALGNPLSKDRLIELATDIEGHPDNVIPAITGGLALSITGSHPIDWIKVDMPSTLTAVVAIPELRIPTSESRQVLPRDVSIDDAVFNSSRTALFMYAIQTQNFQLLKQAMQDRLHQPHRAKLHRSLDSILESAYIGGAHGAALSGSGSAVLAFCTSDADTIGMHMCEAAESAGIECQYLKMPLQNFGYKILK
tara:strand:- start:2103 stop:3014 length:912 start_codon:yes stop_codon:yes gene_type:complete